MIVINLFDLISIILVAIIILIVVTKAILTSIGNKFKKNCFECKYYKLRDVASFGDKCWYECEKKKIENGHSMNDKEHFMKCKEFERRNDE